MNHIIYHPIITKHGKEIKLVFRNIILGENAINLKMKPDGQYIRCHQSKGQQDIMGIMELLDDLEGEDE
jgi:hypothetical protein